MKIESLGLSQQSLARQAGIVAVAVFSLFWLGDGFAAGLACAILFCGLVGWLN
jgi:hypothetical protein